jgi:ankyrin repeat protein
MIYTIKKRRQSMSTLFRHTIACIILLTWVTHENACDRKSTLQQAGARNTGLTSITARQMQDIWQLHNTVKNKDITPSHGCINIGAFANVKNRHGETPLQMATLKKYYEAAQVLINYGANVNESSNFPPLHIAAKRGDAKIAALLLKNGADVDMQDYKKETPLLIAIVNDHTKTARLLIQNGANANPPHSQNVCLFFAATDKSNSLIQSLLHAGASPKMRGKHGETALHIAVACENYSALQTLVEHGADIHAETTYGDSARRIALDKRDNQKLADHLQTIYDTNKSIPYGIEPADTQWYMSQGAQTTTLFDKGSLKTKQMLLDTFQIYAYIHENPHRIKEDVYSNLIEKKPIPWLFYAIQCNHRETLISLLTKYQISSNKPTNAHGKRLLHYAARYNRKQITHDLLRLGTIEQLSYKDNNGRTPESIAQKYHPKTIGNIIADEKIRYQLLKKASRALHNTDELPAEMIQHILSYTHIQDATTEPA